MRSWSRRASSSSRAEACSEANTSLSSYSTSSYAWPEMRASDSPHTDVESAYIDLLKRSLLDLVNARTYAMKRGPDGLEPAEVDEQDLEMRLIGKDWPVNGTTMIGMKRLDNLQHCISEVIESGVPGDLIETGVWRGGASIFMRGMLRAHGVTDRAVWVADSFRGIPPPNADEYPPDEGNRMHMRDFLAVSLADVQANFERFGLLDDQVRFLEGWFRDTLPTVRDRRWAVVRLDGDLYESTINGLENLYPGLSPGGYLIVDDYNAL